VNDSARKGGVRIPPGEERVVFRRDSSAQPTEGRALAVVATQSESLDDGGSQSALGIMTIEQPMTVRVEFDVKEGTVVSVPATAFSVTVRNANEEGQPSLLAAAYPLVAAPPVGNTRTFDIGFGMADPNIRVPAFAQSLVFDHGLPDHQDYRALLSDSASGETYGLLDPGVRRAVDQRTRFVRFVDLPEGSSGTVTFSLGV
jgi:hypothetical protein